jgi:hypothetical protein
VWVCLVVPPAVLLLALVMQWIEGTLLRPTRAAADRTTSARAEKAGARYAARTARSA